MENTITVEIKHSDGNRLVYPICDKAVWFARIAGTKTLTSSLVQYIKQLGYQIEVKTPAL